MHADGVPEGGMSVVVSLVLRALPGPAVLDDGDSPLAVSAAGSMRSQLLGHGHWPSTGSTRMAYGMPSTTTSTRSLAVAPMVMVWVRVTGVIIAPARR
jgi:hypothetical protein